MNFGSFRSADPTKIPSYAVPVEAKDHIANLDEAEIAQLLDFSASSADHMLGFGF